MILLVSIEPPTPKVMMATEPSIPTFQPAVRLNCSRALGVNGGVARGCDEQRAGSDRGWPNGYASGLNTAAAGAGLSLLTAPSFGWRARLAERSLMVGSDRLFRLFARDGKARGSGGRPLSSEPLDRHASCLNTARSHFHQRVAFTPLSGQACLVAPLDRCWNKAGHIVL